ncbi:MAG: hypothetical protein V2I33_24440, partial [Kangiellaceae bacterium]|nr:hypothetical protein [Kangiellaceae bacterium]
MVLGFEGDRERMVKEYNEAVEKWEEDARPPFANIQIQIREAQTAAPSDPLQAITTDPYAYLLVDDKYDDLPEYD